MGIASKFQIVMMNKYSKSEWNTFDNIEVLQILRIFLSIKAHNSKYSGTSVIALASKVQVAMVNKYSKFGWNSFDSIEVIDV